MKTFTFINNEKLCETIESASQYIIYAAPSIAESVAQSLCKFTERNSDTALRVIVDAEADVVNNQATNNYRAMVCAFLTSAEYQRRFGSAVTRMNSDCAVVGP